MTIDNLDHSTNEGLAEDYPSSRVRLGKGGENNLKLDTKLQKPQVECHKSKRDSEDENVILPTIDPFNHQTNTYPKLPRQA
jgi:hypothetical protein